MPRNVLESACALAARLLWPDRCAACDELVAAGDAFCAACAVSVMQEPGDAGAALVYGGAVTTAILRFKHGGRADLARPLGRCLAPVLVPALAGADAVVPVPLHPRRLRVRGFNQALALVRGARGAAGRPRDWPPVWVDTLRRTRDTPVLGHHSPEARRRLVEGAFAVADRRRVAGRRVLVVDDVMTTGATLGGCARALHEAGAAGVSTVVLARVLPVR